MRQNLDVVRCLRSIMKENPDQFGMLLVLLILLSLVGTLFIMNCLPLNGL